MALRSANPNCHRDPDTNRSAYSYCHPNTNAHRHSEINPNTEV